MFFNKRKAIKNANILYDKMLDATETIHKIIIQYPEFGFALDLSINGFVETTVLFLYAIYRAEFCNDYNIDEIFSLIRHGVKCLSGKSNLYTKSSRFEDYWHLYCEIMQAVNQSVELADSLNCKRNDRYNALTALYIRYVFNQEALKKMDKELEVKFNALFNQLVRFFESFCDYGCR